MVIVTDTFDWEEFPVFVQPGEDARTIERKYSLVGEGKDKMTKVMEVYHLGMDRHQQVWVDTNVFNYDLPAPKETSDGISEGK